MAESANEDLLVGVYVGNYRVVARLGKGGMGSVYLAEHPIIGKRVAIKVLQPDLADKQNIVARFFSEGRAINEIQHPHIVDIADFGTLADDGTGRKTAYLVMEYLDGRSLRDVIRDEAPLAVERAVHIGVQIAGALAASHRKGIIHRDLKPDNIMLVERPEYADYVKVVDFGIAKLVGDQLESEHQTQTGTIMGTPKYMSPEQCEGKGDVDFRTDIYSLGILLYAMLTRRLPFTGTGYGELVVQHLTVAPEPPSRHRPEIPPALEQVCLRALEKQKDDRFQSMEELSFALSSAGGPGDALGPASAAQHPKPAETAPAMSLETSDLSGLDSVQPDEHDGEYTPAGLMTDDAFADDASSSAHGPAAFPDRDAPARPKRPWARYTTWTTAAVLVFVGVIGLHALAGGSDPEGAKAGSPDTQGAARDGETVPAAEAGLASDGEDVGVVGDPGPGALVGPPLPERLERAAHVDITLHSTPRATIYVEGQKRTKTPHTLELERDEAVELRLEAPGHRPYVTTIVADEDETLDVSLERRRRRPPGPAAGDGSAASRKPSGRDEAVEEKEEEEEELDERRTLNPLDKYD